MPIEFTFYLWVGSLCLSAAAVVLFLWLMREEPERGSREGEVGKPGGEAKTGD